MCFKNHFNSKIKTNCPICRREIKKQEYSNKSKEDLDYEQEKKARRFVKSIKNKTREDFELVTDFNQYLEEIEDDSNFLNKS